jgi:hypothetical protein
MTYEEYLREIYSTGAYMIGKIGPLTSRAGIPVTLPVE